jgi:membrane-associated phospholipid phosphatase
MTQLKVVKPIRKIAGAAQQVARGESAPSHVRRHRALLFRVVLSIVAAAFAVLTLLVKTMPSFTIDLQISRAIQTVHLPLFAWLMSLISWPGFSPQSFIITGLIILLIYAFGLHWETIMSLAAAVFSTLINVLFKELIQRPRPTSALVDVFATLNSYSFPSGHVMFYLCFYGFIAFLVFSLLKPSVTRTLILVFFGTLIVLVGPSRIYLGEHWASDVLGSVLLGSLTLMATIQFYVWGKPRFFVHQPVAAVEPHEVKNVTASPRASSKRKSRKAGANGVRPPRKRSVRNVAEE